MPGLPEAALRGTGYDPLTEHCYPCDIVAPSLIPRRAGDRVKTNRREALPRRAHLRMKRIHDFLQRGGFRLL